ncbi:cytochrome c [bacterium]|nr:cytochrome c [bacterium]
MQIRTLLLISLFAFLCLALTQSGQEKPLSYSNLTPAQIAGKHLFTLKKCADCHTLGAEADGKLTPVTNKRDDDWFAAHMEKESPIVLREEKSKRRQKRVLRTEITALDEFLYASKDDAKKQIDGMPENIFEGGYLVFQQTCLNCHAVAGFGKEVAPDLTSIGKKHDKKWFVANLKNPQQFAPESLMPKFDFLSEEQLGKIADYLGSLK